MSRLYSALVLLPLCLPICTQAHMQMSWPYPLRSPLDPAVSVEYKDYSMTNPLFSDGSNFPCKLYQNSDTNPQANDIKATYSAGSTYNLTLEGGATHMGGSCQISISYDNGATFKVIESIIGGCPLVDTYDFTIPSFAPSSDTALLSWSWFNLIGNREMYQNCARVQIQGTPIQRYRRRSYKRQSSIDELPDMFVCNVNNGCTTIEGAEVVFPDPGSSVSYGEDAVAPEAGPGFVITGSNPSATTAAPVSTASFDTASNSTLAPFPLDNTTATATPAGTGVPDFTTTALTTSTGMVLTNSSDMTITSSATSTSTSIDLSGPVTVTVTITVTADSNGVPTTSLSTLTTTLVPTNTAAAFIARDTTFTTIIVSPNNSTNNSSSPTATSIPTLPCTPGTYFCNTPSTFSSCTSNNTYTYMGSVAAGMTCVDGAIIRQNAGPCAVDGAVVCNGESAFYLCDQGGLVSMGAVAGGTRCVDGAIVPA